MHDLEKVSKENMFEHAKYMICLDLFIRVWQTIIECFDLKSEYL